MSASSCISDILFVYVFFAFSRHCLAPSSPDTVPSPIIISSICALAVVSSSCCCCNAPLGTSPASANPLVSSGPLNISSICPLALSTTDDGDTLPATFTSSPAPLVAPPIVPPKAAESIILSAISMPVYSPPVSAAPPMIALSCSASVPASPAVALPIRAAIALPASGLPAFAKAVINSSPVILDSLPLGITLPAPNLSNIPTRAPTPTATLASYVPVLSSISCADSPAPINTEEPIVAPVIAKEAGILNGAVIAAKPVPTIAVPLDTTFSMDFSFNQPRALSIPPC